MRIILIYGCALMLSMPNVKLLAQTDSLQTRFLDEVIISASRSEQLIKDVPRSVSIIDQKKIEESTYNSIGDLLSTQEGVYLVGANQTPGTNQTLFLRGAGGNQVLVMIDGVRITDPSTPNNAIDLSELSLAQVERIEILKGSHSTLYGSAAVGGVVNIITKAAAQSGFHGSVSVLGGSLSDGASNFSQQANISYAFENGIYIDAAAFNQNANGLNSALDTVANRFQKPDRDNFEKIDGSLKMGYRNNGLHAHVAYRSANQRADIDNGAFSDDDNSYLKYYRDFWNYGASYRIGPQLHIRAIGSISNSRRTTENDSSLIAPGVYDNNYFAATYNGQLMTHEAQINYNGKRVDVLFGGGSYGEKMNFDTYFFSSAFGGFESETNYDSINTKAMTNYLFGQVQLDAGFQSRLKLVIGARYSDHSLFGNFFTYEFNPSFTVNENTILYTSFSTGFNAPSLYQLYDPTQGSPLISRGNVGLNPEESSSVEMGLKKSFAGGQYVTASLFNTTTNNSIEYVYVWNKNTAIPELSFFDYLGDTYINLSRQTVYGLELSAFGTYQNFELSGNITWLKGSIDSEPGDIPTAYVDGNHVQLFSNGTFLNTEYKQENLARRPQITAFAQLRYKLNQGVSIYSNYRLAGARFDSFYDPDLGPFGAQGLLEVNSYSLVDLGANLKLSDRFQLTSSIENVFNTQYQEINGFATRGRSAYLKLIYKW